MIEGFVTLSHSYSVQVCDTRTCGFGLVHSHVGVCGSGGTAAKGQLWSGFCLDQDGTTLGSVPRCSVLIAHHTVTSIHVCSAPIAHHTGTSVPVCSATGRWTPTNHSRVRQLPQVAQVAPRWCVPVPWLLHLPNSYTLVEIG